MTDQNIAQIGRSRQLDGGQRDGYYNWYLLNLDTDTRGHVVLGYIYVTAASMGEEPPTIGGVPMAPDTEYWVFDSNVVPELRASNHIHIEWRGELDASVEVGDGEAVYGAQEQTQWTNIEFTEGIPTGPRTYWTQAGTVRGAGFDTDDTAVLSVWWFQTGNANLTHEALNNVELYADSSGPGTATIYVASSRLVPQGG